MVSHFIMITNDRKSHYTHSVPALTICIFMYDTYSIWLKQSPLDDQWTLTTQRDREREREQECVIERE